MATWPTMTQTGGPKRWTVWGGNITNHEAFAFTLQSAEHDVGALISNIAVYVDQSGAGGEPSYNITLSAVNQGGSPVNKGITGNFESNGV
ncbi:MAG TPA: hypothetical protein VN900_03975 [Stellaceae bacterium]|jgi:hypothetical protein|nr:hypothetical protein [Stellaceae bacterium]